MLSVENQGIKRLDGLSCHSLLAQTRQDIRQMTSNPVFGTLAVDSQTFENSASTLVGGLPEDDPELETDSRANLGVQTPRS